MRARIPKVGKTSYAEKFNRALLKKVGVKRGNVAGRSGTPKEYVAPISERFRSSVSRIQGKKY